MSDVAPTTRAERRAHTEAVIVQAARDLFAERGYQRATIRAVADRARCDPALVMKYFGNKIGLFSAATAISIDIAEVYAGPEDTRTERVLRHTFERLDAHADSVASTLRSMLTHDQSADEALQLFNAPRRGDSLAEDNGDPRAALRQDLLLSLTLGTAITRYVLKASAVQNATLEELLAILLPAAKKLEA